MVNKYRVEITKKQSKMLERMASIVVPINYPDFEVIESFQELVLEISKNVKKSDRKRKYSKKDRDNKTKVRKFNTKIITPTRDIFKE